MKKAGIAIDRWKLSIFERHLTQAGYQFTKVDFTPDTFMLSVHTENPIELYDVVKAANEEAARSNRLGAFPNNVPTGGSNVS